MPVLEIHPDNDFRELMARNLGKFLSVFGKVAEDVAGFGAKASFYQSGKIRGRTIGFSIINIRGEEESVDKGLSLVNWWFENPWRIKVNGSRLRLEDCPIRSSIDEVGNPVCYLVHGLLAGCLCTITRKNIDLRYLGDCEMEILVR